SVNRWRAMVWATSMSLTPGSAMGPAVRHQGAAEIALPREADGGATGELGAVVAEFLAALAQERGASANTFAAYERDVRQFLGWLRTELDRPPALADLALLDAKRFRAFMAARRRAVASRSLARTMSALRTFFRWLDAKGTLENSSLLQLALPKVPHGVPKPLTVAKAAAVVGRDGNDWVSARDRAVLLLLYGSGLRISE